MNNKSAMQASAPQPNSITSMTGLNKFIPEAQEKDVFLVSPKILCLMPGFDAAKQHGSEQALKRIASLRKQWNTDPSQIRPIHVTLSSGNVYVVDGHSEFLSLREAMEQDGLDMPHVYCIMQESQGT